MLEKATKERAIKNSGWALGLVLTVLLGQSVAAYAFYCMTTEIAG